MVTTTKPRYMRFTHTSVLLVGWVLAALSGCGDQQESDTLRPLDIETQDELRPHITAWIESGSYYVQANQIAFRGGIERRPMNNQEIDTARSLIKKAVATASRVDPAKLNKVYPGFGDHFQDDFSPGIELRLDALEDPRRGKMNEADALLQRWDDWYFTHQADLKQRLREAGIPVE